MEPLSHYILLNTAENLFLVPFTDVMFIKSDGPYTYVIGIEENQWELSKPMTTYQLLFEDKGFCRIHRSYIVNVRHIRKVDKVEKIVTLTNGSSIPYSKPGYKALLQLLKERHVSTIQGEVAAKV